MRRWSIPIAVGMLVGSWATDGAAQVPLEHFYGSWQGTALSSEEAPDGLEVRPEDLNVTIRADGNGFRVRWTALERTGDDAYARRAADARFAPTERAGVYAYDEGSPSLLGRLFASPATGNPLEGETLLWARLEGPTLTIYSLGLTDDGGFDLDTYARTLTDDAMEIVHTRRSEDPPLLVVRGELEPSGD